MFDDKYRLVLSIVGAATTLLGWVGIFVSLTVQRRVERLQDILEEFLDLSYHSDTNITGKMYNLIEKYQMHYMFPATPVKVILHYINFTIITVILSWLIVSVEEFRWSYDWFTLLTAIPLVFGFALLFFFRRLLKSLIYPFGNNLMSPLIPPPAKLRSVSFLSRYVNVSVKSILSQARLRLVIKDIHNEGRAKVILKEELSFDDFFYYLIIKALDEPLFTAFGKLLIKFENDSVTGKPIPVAKNVNIPLGYISSDIINEVSVEAKLFIFPRGEKNPVQYIFNLKGQENVAMMINDPEISVNYMITYQIQKNKLNIIKNEENYPFFDVFCGKSFNAGKQYWCANSISQDKIEKWTVKAYID